MAVSRQQIASLSQRRLWGFRIAAVLLGLAPFLLLELVCSIGGWGRETSFDDPYAGFSEIHPLFVRDQSGTRFEIAPGRLKYFAQDSFPAEKSSDTFRIFCLGGSTVQGRPYSISTAFSSWLRLSLTAADETQNWEVVNCGGISYASYRLVPILKECLTHQPDLIVICTGHNEFLEERTYKQIKHASPTWTYTHNLLSRLRSIALLRHAVESWGSNSLELSHRNRVETAIQI